MILWLYIAKVVKKRLQGNSILISSLALEITVDCRGQGVYFNSLRSSEQGQNGPFGMFEAQSVMQSNAHNKMHIILIANARDYSALSARAAPSAHAAPNTL